MSHFHFVFIHCSASEIWFYLVDIEWICKIESDVCSCIAGQICKIKNAFYHDWAICHDCHLSETNSMNYGLATQLHKKVTAWCCWMLRLTEITSTWHFLHLLIFHCRHWKFTKSNSACLSLDSKIAVTLACSLSCSPLCCSLIFALSELIWFHV